MADETPPSFSDFSFSSIGKNSLLRRLSARAPLAQTQDTAGTQEEDMIQELDDDVDDNNDMYIDMDSISSLAEITSPPALLARLGDAPVSSNLSRSNSLGGLESTNIHAVSQQPQRIDIIDQRPMTESYSSLASSSRFHSHSIEDECIPPTRTNNPLPTNIIAGSIPPEFNAPSTVTNYNASLSISSGHPTPPSSGGTMEVPSRDTTTSALSAGHSTDPARLASFTGIQFPFTPLTEFLNEERAAWGEVWESKQALSHPDREASASAVNISPRTEVMQKASSGSASTPKYPSQVHNSGLQDQVGRALPKPRPDQPQITKATVSVPSASSMRLNGVDPSTTVRATSLSTPVSTGSRYKKATLDTADGNSSYLPVDNPKSSNTNDSVVNPSSQPVISQAQAQEQNNLAQTSTSATNNGRAVSSRPITYSSTTEEQRRDELKALLRIRRTSQGIESQTIPKHNAQPPSERLSDGVPLTPISRPLPFHPTYRYVDSRDSASPIASLVPSKRRVSAISAPRNRSISGSVSSTSNKQLANCNSSTLPLPSSEAMDLNQPARRHKREDDRPFNGSSIVISTLESHIMPKNESVSYLPLTPTSSAPNHLPRDVISNVNRKRSLSNAFKAEDETDSKLKFPVNKRPLKKVKEEAIGQRVVIKKEEEEEVSLEKLGAEQEEPAQGSLPCISSSHPQPGVDKATQVASLVSIPNVAPRDENALDIATPIPDLSLPDGLSQRITEPPIIYPTQQANINIGLPEGRQHRTALAERISSPQRNIDVSDNGSKLELNPEETSYRHRQRSAQKRSPSVDLRRRRTPPIRFPSRGSTTSERRGSRNGSSYGSDRRSGGERGRSRDRQARSSDHYLPPLNRSPPYSGDSYRPSSSRSQNLRRIDNYRAYSNGGRTPPRFDRERQRTYQTRSRSPVASYNRSPRYRYSRSPRRSSPPRGRYNSPGRYRHPSPSRPSGTSSNVPLPFREQQHIYSRNANFQPYAKDDARSVYRGEVNTPFCEDSLHQPLQQPSRSFANLYAGTSTEQEAPEPSSRQINPSPSQVKPAHERSRTSIEAISANDSTSRCYVNAHHSTRPDGPSVEQRQQAPGLVQRNYDSLTIVRGQSRQGERFLRNISPNDIRTEATKRTGSFQDRRAAGPASSLASDTGPAPSLSQDYENRLVATESDRNNSENRYFSSADSLDYRHVDPIRTRSMDNERENQNRAYGGTEPRDTRMADGDFANNNNSSSGQVEARRPPDYHSASSSTATVNSIPAAPSLSTIHQRQEVAVVPHRDHTPAPSPRLGHARHQKSPSSLLDRIAPTREMIKQPPYTESDTNSTLFSHQPKESQRAHRAPITEKLGTSGDSSLSSRLALEDRVQPEKLAQVSPHQDLSRRMSPRTLNDMPEGVRRRSRTERSWNAGTGAPSLSLASRLEGPLSPRPVSHAIRGAPRGGSSLFSRMSNPEHPNEQQHLGHGTTRGRGRGRGAASARSRNGTHAREQFSPGKPPLEDRLT